MPSEPRFVGSDQDDLDDELTQLEWEASQRTLSAAESQRLSQLRQQKQELVKDVAERVSPPEPESGNTVISGDDSP